MKKANKTCLVLAGSGEFTPAMDATDRMLIAKAGEYSGLDNYTKVKVAVVPTASCQEHDYYRWVTEGINHFTKLKAIPSGIELRVKKDSGNWIFIERIRKFQIIYFSGGNPGYLFDTIKGSEFLKEVKNRYNKGVILAGSSAGAMVMGNYVLVNVYAVFEDREKPVWKRGFNLFPLPIIPHFDYILKKEKAKFEKMMSESPKEIRYNYCGIDEDTAIIFENGKKAKVTGSGKVTLRKNGKLSSISPGDTFRI